jgi:hypothetical protein
MTPISFSFATSFRGSAALNGSGPLEARGPVDWAMVLDANGKVADTPAVRYAIAKKRVGRRIPMRADFRRGVRALPGEGNSGLPAGSICDPTVWSKVFRPLGRTALRGLRFSLRPANFHRKMAQGAGATMREVERNHAILSVEARSGRAVILRSQFADNSRPASADRFIAAHFCILHVISISDTVVRR